VLSHRAAAALWGLIRWTPGAIDVIVPRKVRRRTGVRLHRTRFLEGETAFINGILCSSVSRTLLDLAAGSDPLLEAAIGEAERRSLLDERAIACLLDRSRGRRGARRLRSALAGFMVETSWTRSELERRFLQLCVEGGLPKPRVNAWIPLPGGGVEVDFSWPAQRLIAETDGHQIHGTRGAFEDDRRRDQRLIVAGWRVGRFTWPQVAVEPERVIETLRRLLAVDIDRVDPYDAPGTGT
jgi:very-short-patch-repair endonuclease